MLQIIFKGKSPKCIAKHDVAQLDERLFFDYAVKKTQTSITFQRLLQEVQRRHAKRAQNMGMAPDTPFIVIIDNAPSHCAIEERVAGVSARHSVFLLQPKDIPNLFLMMTRKNRSHELNSGDQLINLNFRTHVRQSEKLRVMNHFLAVRRGKLPPGTPLDVGEATMKALLLQWCTLWLNMPLKSSILKLWDLVMRHKVLDKSEQALPNHGVASPFKPFTFTPQILWFWSATPPPPSGPLGNFGERKKISSCFEVLP